MNLPLNRRTFLGSAIAGALAGPTLALRAGGEPTVPPNLKLGLIGCGWYGMVDVQAAFKVGGVEVIAICDVDSQHTEECADKIERLQGKRPRARLGCLLRETARLRHPRRPGHGHLVDWGIHLIDAVRWTLHAAVPKSVQAAGGICHFKDQITTPDTLTAHFEFDAFPLTWHHRIWGAEEYAPEVNNGIFFYGEHETVFVTDDRWVTIPRGKGKERQVHEAKADLGTLHMAEFLTAVRTRHPVGCPPADGFDSTAAVQLAMIAYETGTKVQWDAGTAEIPGNPGAARLLKRDYRAPWQHPG